MIVQIKILHYLTRLNIVIEKNIYNIDIYSSIVVNVDVIVVVVVVFIYSFIIIAVVVVVIMVVVNFSLCWVFI